MRFVPFFAALAFFTAGSATLADVDALDARILSDDADRFAAVFDEANGAPTAEALYEGYLAPGSRGVEIFTPNRIQDAAHLAEAIAANPSDYRRAIDVCLPIAKDMTKELRSIYLAFEGLLGDPLLPEIYVLFGSGNSGGTAGPNAQVLGLEVICQLDRTEEEIRKRIRSFLAHETVHTMQSRDFARGKDGEPGDLLLASALLEGGADYIAMIVTGRSLDPSRDEWAAARADFVRNEFLHDREKIAALDERAAMAEDSPFYRWFANAFSPPDEGWPPELGYWVGRDIWERYIEQADDKRAATREILNIKDAEAILRLSGYAESPR